MKALKASDLRGKSSEELQQMMQEIHVEQFSARRDFVFRRSTDLASVKVRRHNIARILTIISEKTKGAEA